MLVAQTTTWLFTHQTNSMILIKYEKAWVHEEELQEILKRNSIITTWSAGKMNTKEYI
jgi:hypothetical protein